MAQFLESSKQYIYQNGSLIHWMSSVCNHNIQGLKQFTDKSTKISSNIYFAIQSEHNYKIHTLFGFTPTPALCCNLHNKPDPYNAPIWTTKKSTPYIQCNLHPLIIIWLSNFTHSKKWLWSKQGRAAFHASSQVILQLGRSKGGKGSARQDVCCTINIDVFPWLWWPLIDLNINLYFSWI